MTIKNKSHGKSFTGTGEDTDWLRVRGRGALTVSGTFSGAVQLIRSDDEGATTAPVLKSDGTVLEITVPGTMAIVEGDNDGALYHCKCSAFTSGTIVTNLKDGNVME